MWDLPPPDPGFELVVASRGMSKGIAQTDGVQAIPKAFIQLGPVQASGQWKNISSPVADGEAAAFLNYSPKLGPYQIVLGAAYKFQTNVVGDPDDDSFEFTASGSRKFGRLSVRLSAVYSPDDIGVARRSLYLEGGPAFEFDKTFRASAAIGRRSRIGAVDYTAFNAGLAKTIFQKLTIDLRYYSTSQSELGRIYRGRVVASGRLAF